MGVLLNSPTPLFPTLQVEYYYQHSVYISLKRRRNRPYPDSLRSGETTWQRSIRLPEVCEGWSHCTRTFKSISSNPHHTWLLHSAINKVLMQTNTDLHDGDSAEHVQGRVFDQSRNMHKSNLFTGTAHLPSLQATIFYPERTQPLAMYLSKERHHLFAWKLTYY
jgi:hypothetical protein